MAIAVKKTVPISEGGDVLSTSLSTAEGARLTTEKPRPSIAVRQPLLSEILTKVHGAKTKAQKIKILQEEDCLALRQICQWSFNPIIESELPSGTPPYIENDAPEGTEHTLLRTEGDKLFNFIKGAQTHQSTVRERMFIRLLEGLHKDEAELLILVKDKKLGANKIGYKGLSSPIVMEAFNWDEDFNKKDV